MNIFSTDDPFLIEKEIKNIITFLEENEQYGDDWQKEIKTLKQILNK